MEEHEKKVIAEEKHKEWIQKKNQQERKREQKINKEMEENVAEELEKEHLQEKSKKYQEWLKKKMLKNVIRKGRKQLQGELQGKKEIAGKKFKEWLENSNNKPCLAAESYGYANGKHRILQWKF